MIRGRGNRRKDAAPSEKKKTKKIADRLFAFRLKPEEVFLERPKKTEVGETNQKIRNVSPRKCKNVQRGIEILEEGETIIIKARGDERKAATSIFTSFFYNLFFSINKSFRFLEGLSIALEGSKCW